MLRDLGDERVVVQMACRGKNHVARREAAGVVVEYDLLVEAGNRLLGPEDRSAQGVPLPEVLREGLVNEVIGFVLIHLDLLEDDALLASDVLRNEGWVEHDVA